MTREQLMEMGYVRIGNSLSLEIYAHFHKDGMISIGQFETDIPDVVQDCGHVLLSEEIFDKIGSMRSGITHKFRLMKKEFEAGEDRAAALLNRAFENRIKDKGFLITQDLSSDEVLAIIDKHKMTFHDYKVFKAVCGTTNIIDTINEHIFNGEDNADYKHIDIYVYGNKEIDFEPFNDMDNVTVYHYFQVNREAIRD